MARKKHRKQSEDARAGEGPAPARMKRKPYEKELRELQVELAHLQQWVKREGAKIVIVFEGRDTAGKGGVIKRITERVSLIGGAVQSSELVEVRGAAPS